VLLDSQTLTVERIVVDAGEASLRLGGVRSATSCELSEGARSLKWLESLARGPETCSVEHVEVLLRLAGERSGGDPLSSVNQELVVRFDWDTGSR